MYSRLLTTRNMIVEKVEYGGNPNVHSIIVATGEHYILTA